MLVVAPGPYAVSDSAWSMHLLDRAPRALISEAGFGERFIHRTGLTTHEPPYMIEG
jgi:Xaa-Pro aminopeptidase